MLEVNEMKLLYWFCKSSSDEAYGIIKLSITIDNKESQLTTALKVSRKEWRGNQKRFIDTEKNTKLKKLEFEVEKLLDYMTVAGCNVTALSLADTYRKLKAQKLHFTAENILKINEPGRKVYTIMELINWLIEDKKTEIEHVTLNGYKYRSKRVEEYLFKIGKPHFIAEQFEVSDLMLFLDHLKTLGNGKNHINRYCIMLKNAFREGQLRKFIVNNSIQYFVYGKEERQDLRHLELDELIVLENLDIKKFVNEEFDNYQALDIARDLFVFSCYTGFHSVDRLGLTDENFVDNMLKGKRNKTKIKFETPLVAGAVRILKKYGSINNLPKMHKDTMNQLLKRLEQMCGFKIGLTTKIGRKTFAHLSLNEWQVDKDTLAVAMGLKSARHVTAYGEIGAKRVKNAYNNI